MIRASHVALIVALSCAAASAAQAQDAAQKDRSQPHKTSGGAQAKADAASPVEVIVTGVLAATKAKDANASYSVLTQDDINRFTPISADDMLRDLPGTVVETNDGVARNEVFTRGMTAGTGSNTSGYFWTTILEDGLPVIPFKFGGFQDGYFYRADISTSRVESVRGGSSATAITTSVGATFNYLSGKIRPGASIQTRCISCGRPQPSRSQLIGSPKPHQSTALFGKLSLAIHCSGMSSKAALGVKISARSQRTSRPPTRTQSKHL